MADLSMELDHLAVCAKTLEQGAEYVETTLGVTLQPGGQHPYYGTHNRLLGLADGLYLEVITIDPDADRPDYPRWFDLDRFEGKPRLTHWICRTTSIAELANALPHAGTPVALSRGDLNWQMAVPDTGVLPYDNRFPPLIEWDGDVHPSQRLPSSGCRLTGLNVTHPKAQDLARELEPFLQDRRVHFETGAPGLRAVFDTPAGPRAL